MASMGSLSRLIGPKYIQLAKSWAPTGAAFGGTAALAGLYLTDWKVIVSYIPFYGTKFQEPKQ